MEEKRMIKDIAIEKLEQHPNNVRKIYNDIEELAESIKAQGILQNLTIVESDVPDKYFVVIGNRRLAAARMAGLTVLPCTIVEMDEKTQTSTMLLENMQRSDLDAFEQAQGFQMCLDLGMTKDELAEKTGLSKTKINKRLEIAKLDQNLVQEKSQEGANIFDFMKLEQIKDIEVRNKVMEALGTSDFQWKLTQAINEEKASAIEEELYQKLSTFAKEVEVAPCNTVHIKSYYVQSSSSLEQMTIPKLEENQEYLFTRQSYCKGFTLFRVTEDNDNDHNSIEEKRNKEMEEEKEKQETERRKELAHTMHELRKQFIKSKTRKSLSENDLLKYVGILLTSASYSKFLFSNSKETEEKNFLYNLGFSSEVYFDIKGLEADNDEGYLSRKIEISKFQAILKRNYKRGIEEIIYSCLEEGEVLPISFDKEYKKNFSLTLLYEFLQKLGYKVSSEEALVLNGTHEIFKKEGK